MRAIFFLVLGPLLATAVEAQKPTPPAPLDGPDFYLSEPGADPRFPVVISEQAISDPIRETFYSRLNLLPIDRYQDVIRYELGLGRYGRSALVTIIQFAVADDSSRVQLLVIEAEASSEATRQLRRELRWISVEEYDALELAVLQAASTIAPEERQGRFNVMVGSHEPWCRLDLRRSGEADIWLRRRSHGSRLDAPAYQAGLLITRAAERALGHPIALDEQIRPAPGSRADSRPDR